MPTERNPAPTLTELRAELARELVKALPSEQWNLAQVTAALTRTEVSLKNYADVAHDNLLRRVETLWEARANKLLDLRDSTPAEQKAKRAALERASNEIVNCLKELRQQVEAAKSPTDR
jgi:hypothetical protein